ncbi:hypothetical protein HUJ04_011691, partial [Dendroctonus ponderosae]
VKSVSSANFKYGKTQFYNGSCASVTNIKGESTLNLRNMEYGYEQVSTPISCVIVCWPSLKKVHNWATLKLIVWFAAQALYFLYITGILPSGRSIPLKRPPWSLEQRAKVSLKKNSVIEQDWESI